MNCSIEARLLGVSWCNLNLPEVSFFCLERGQIMLTELGLWGTDMVSAYSMGGVFCSEAGGRARISWFIDSAESKARQFHGMSHEHAGSGRIVSAWPIPPLESTHRHGAAELTELAWAIPSNNFIASGSSSSPKTLPSSEFCISMLDTKTPVPDRRQCD